MFGRYLSILPVTLSNFQKTDVRKTHIVLRYSKVQAKKVTLILLLQV